MHPYHLIICMHHCRTPCTHPHLMSISLANTTLGMWSLCSLQYIVVTPNSYKREQQCSKEGWTPQAHPLSLTLKVVPVILSHIVAMTVVCIIDLASSISL